MIYIRHKNCSRILLVTHTLTFSLIVIIYIPRNKILPTIHPSQLRHRNFCSGRSVPPLISIYLSFPTLFERSKLKVNKRNSARTGQTYFFSNCRFLCIYEKFKYAEICVICENTWSIDSRFVYNPKTKTNFSETETRKFPVSREIHRFLLPRFSFDERKIS